MNEQTQVMATQNDTGGVFGSMKNFADAQRMAQLLSSSSMVPREYQGKEGLPNCLVAMEMAQRTGAGIFAVMQNLHVIQGRPSWSASFIAAMLNTCKRFDGTVRYVLEGSGADMSCYAEATDAATGQIVRGPKITMQMAKDEGWISKNGSKWRTMPEVMIRYRAASFFGRLYASDLLMGMHSDDEVRDGITDVETPSAVLNELNAGIAENSSRERVTYSLPEAIDEVRKMSNEHPSKPEAKESHQRIEPDGRQIPPKSKGLGLFEETLGNGLPPSDTNGAV